MTTFISRTRLVRVLHCHHFKNRSSSHPFAYRHKATSFLMPPHLHGAGKLRISHLFLMTCDFFYILLSLRRHFVKEKSQKRLVIIFFLVYIAIKSEKEGFSQWKLKGMFFRTIYITTKNIFGRKLWITLWSWARMILLKNWPAKSFMLN